MPKEPIGLSLQDLNKYTAHAAHQADRSAAEKIKAATTPQAGPLDSSSYDDDEQQETGLPFNLGSNG